MPPHMNVPFQLYHHDQPYAMERGGRLPSFELAYETWGHLDDARDNAVLLFTGMSPSAHAASHDGNPEPGWWEPMIGPGRPVDTDRYFVICANSLGSCKGSTGPATPNPETGLPYQLDFPDLTLGDIASTTHELLSHLGITTLDTVIGPSMGGMTALAHVLLYPGLQRRLISISSAVAPSAYAIAVRSLQRELVRSDPAWSGGRYAPDPGPIDGMRLARKLGMTTYRSADEWRERFGNERLPEIAAAEPFPLEFQIESYLALHAERFAASFDANCFLYLSRAMDRFDATRVRGGLGDRLADSGLEQALVMGTATDALFPLYQQRELGKRLDAAGIDTQLREMPSLQGHDSFLVDAENFGLVIADFLANQ